MSLRVNRTSGVQQPPEEFERCWGLSSAVAELAKERAQPQQDLRKRRIVDIRKQWETFYKSLRFFSKALSMSFSCNIIPMRRKINRLTTFLPPPGKPITHARSDATLDIVRTLQNRSDCAKILVNLKKATAQQEEEVTEEDVLAFKEILKAVGVVDGVFIKHILVDTEVLLNMGVKLKTTPEATIEAFFQARDLSMNTMCCRLFEQYLSFFMLELDEPSLLNLPLPLELEAYIPQEMHDKCFVFIVDRLLQDPTDGGKVGIARDYSDRILDETLKERALKKCLITLGDHQTSISYRSTSETSSL